VKNNPDLPMYTFTKSVICSKLIRKGLGNLGRVELLNDLDVADL